MVLEPSVRRVSAGHTLHSPNAHVQKHRGAELHKVGIQPSTVRALKPLVILAHPVDVVTGVLLY